MPNLPTIAVTQPQQDKVLAAFGGTIELAIPAYKAWLTGQVRQYVLDSLMKQMVTDYSNARAAAVALVTAELPPDPPV